MKYKKQVERIMAHISKECPDAVLKAMNISPKRLSDSIDAMVRKGMTVHTAEATLKKMWDNALPQPTSATEQEMVMMGFRRDAVWWIHDKAGLTITESDRKALSFHDVERKVIEAGVAKERDTDAKGQTKYYLVYREGSV